MYQYATTTRPPNGNNPQPHPPDQDPNAPSAAPPQPNNWTHPGPAAYDLRSDTITTPTASQLLAITHTTLLDDVYLEDPTTTAFESLLASLTAHPAALFVVSGTMANQLALRSHLSSPPHSVLADHRSHILTSEAGGLALLSGAMTTCVVPRNGHHLTLEDVQAHAVTDEDIHHAPTRVIGLENTLHGTIMPLAEVRRIGAWARERGIRTHLDGARLWEVEAAGAGSVREYASAVDSVSLCFSKGLGAAMGSVVVGSEAFIKRCRWVRKSIGGGIRMAGILTAGARAALDDVFLSGRLRENQQRAARVARGWEGLGGRLRYPTETNMVWLDLEASGIGTERFIAVAQEYGLRTMGGRLVVHYQVCEDALRRVEAVGRELLRGEETRELKGRAEVPPEELKINVE